MKTVLFLGAAQFQVPPILYAREKGYRVITCDNRPDNPGHKYANKSYDISTVDHASVLQISRKENIDGILAFGSDVSAPTAAIVAEEMHLPGNRLDAIRILTRKDLFRQFLNKTGLQKNTHGVFSLTERAKLNEFIVDHPLPLVIKPVDGAGSKGVGIIADPSKASALIDNAFKESTQQIVIIENFVEKRGRQVCGDGYFENGKVKFMEFGDGHFYDDGHYLAPYGETFPSDHDPVALQRLRVKVEQILLAAGFSIGPFNLDAFIDQQNQPFVIEIGPRSGGNFIPSAIRYRTGVDLIAAAVEASLSADFSLTVDISSTQKFVACYMLHSKTSGVLKEVRLSPQIQKLIVEYNPYLAQGDRVEPFLKANRAVGNLIMQFQSKKEMDEIMASIHSQCHIDLQELTP